MPAKKQVNEIINLKLLSKEQAWDLQAARWKARTDLGWLCRNVLGFEHVTDDSSFPCPLEDGPDGPIHQPIIDILQKFPIPTPKQFSANDYLLNGKWVYTPIVPLTQLTGPRRVLLLDPRGFLKTTINVVAHTIQWIINYPDLCMMIIQSNGDKARDFLKKIKLPFQGNETFRKIFPEHCPKTNVSEWGTQDRFVSEARSSGCMRAEPTVMATSIDKGAAGYHVDVMKFSDIVDPTNINGNGIQQVKDAFYMMQNLLVGPKYWIDVEGTRYHSADLYGEIIEHEAAQPEHKREYRIHARPVFEQGPIEPVPANLGAPYLLDANGKRISRWPRRFSLKDLESQESRDPATFATQQLNDPTKIGGAQPFPVKDGEFEKRIITAQTYRQNVRIAYKEISIDCAYTIGHRSDYTAMVVGAFDQYGRCYIEQIVHGRYLPDEICARLTALIIQHKDHLKCLKIEDAAFTHGLMPGLRRILDTRNLSVTVSIIPRDNDKSKHTRILNTLQPYYHSKDLRFVDSIGEEVLRSLKIELGEFPARHDDILDAISDLFQDKQWFGRETPLPQSEEERRHYYAQKTRELMARLFDETYCGVDPTSPADDYFDAPSPTRIYDRTGF